MYCHSCGEEVTADADACTSCGTSLSDESEVVGGLDENVAGALAYALTFVSGLILYFVETDNDFVRFHAVQSIVVFGGLALTLLGLSVLGWIFSQIPVLGFLIGLVLWVVEIGVQLAGFVAWIVLMVKAFQGERFELPYAGEIADDYV